MNEKYIPIIKKLYEIFDGHIICKYFKNGKLYYCRLCCKGVNPILLPGEEFFFKGKCQNVNGYNFIVVCEPKSCLRPYVCRIYPIHPILTDKGWKLIKLHCRGFLTPRFIRELFLSLLIIERYFKDWWLENQDLIHLV